MFRQQQSIGVGVNNAAIGGDSLYNQHQQQQRQQSVVIGGDDPNQNMHNQQQQQQQPASLNNSLQEINIPPTELLNQPNLTEMTEMKNSVNNNSTNHNANNIHNANSIYINNNARNILSENGQPNTISDTNPFRSVVPPPPDNIICHEHCGLEFISAKGSSGFGHCWCMGPNKVCRICGCGPVSHFHDKIKLTTETQTIDQVLEDMKAQYDIADQKHRKISANTNTYQSTLKSLEAAADDKYREIHKLCIDLSKVCSRFNFVDELHANIENMKQDARAMQNNDMRNKAEMEIRKLEKMANDLSAKQMK
ncbi:5567_t:CDS:2 [Ambispora leptoticha]|uniref:5567_t:CDS:1 n=1 Tax=Ambispora leptoticha TaxID=144679 RepID=A0A9N8W3Z5_9GLOM|nr:5567_t:CDS:2 [Ambispora leptoticha]